MPAAAAGDVHSGRRLAAVCRDARPKMNAPKINAPQDKEVRNVGPLKGRPEGCATFRPDWLFGASIVELYCGARA
jgi:hypothetical protein